MSLMEDGNRATENLVSYIGCPVQVPNEEFLRREAVSLGGGRREIESLNCGLDRGGGRSEER